MPRTRSSSSARAPKPSTGEFRFIGETERVLIDVQRLDGSTLLAVPNQTYRLPAHTAHPLLVPVGDGDTKPDDGDADDAGDDESPSESDTSDTPDAPPEPGAEDDTTPDPS